MEKTYNIRQRHPSQLSIPSRQRAHSQGQGTLCGRLGQALRSDAYADFREGQLTLVNHSRKVALPTFPAPGCVPSVGVRIFTTHFPHKKEGASYLLPKVPGTIMKKCYQK